LKERFAKIEIQASPPIVPFRETAIQAVDMVPPKTKDAPRGTIHGNVQGNLVEFTVRARPLPAEITAFLTAHIETLKRVVQRERELSNKAEPATYEDSTQDTGAEGQGEQAAALANLNPDDFWKHLEALFTKAGREWQGVASRIWAFGPRRIGPNILVDAHSTDRS
jgi:ribosome assembly protein 1